MILDIKPVQTGGIEIPEVEFRLNDIYLYVDQIDTLFNWLCAKWEDENPEIFQNKDREILKSEFKQPLLKLKESKFLDKIPMEGYDSIMALYIKIMGTAQTSFPRAYELLNKFFYPKFADDQDKELYGKQHLEVYQPEIENIVNWARSVKGYQVYTIESGMFGGKSTLSFEAIKRLEAEGIKVFTCVGLPQEELMSRNHPEKMKCRRVTETSLNNPYEDAEGNLKPSIKDQMTEFAKENPNGVVYLDEFSFMAESVHEDFRAHVENLGLKLLQTGLSHDALNRPLSLATRYFKYGVSDRTFQCRSFVKNDNGAMVGTRTMRFFILENGQPMPDFAACGGIIIEGATPSILYYPVGEGDHVANVLVNHPALGRAQAVPFYGDKQKHQENFTNVIFVHDRDVAVMKEEEML